MEKWDHVYQQVLDKIKSSKVDSLFFRGHSNAEWKLIPKLGRIKNKEKERTEQIAYYDYVTRSGALIPESSSSWNHVFSMQHHGVPTRLLDWTESFAVALFFALKGSSGTACVWILNPFSLNKANYGFDVIPSPNDLDHSYKEIYIDQTQNLGAKVIAMSPLRHHPRIFQQKAGVTLHDDLLTPLDDLCSDALVKIEIPDEARKGAKDFLKLSGISEFSVFPDLDGLAREINEEHFLM